MENMKLSVILQHINNLNIKIMKKFLFLMLSAFIITACNDDDKTLTKEKIPLSTDSLTYMYHGGFRYVEIDEEDWYIQKVVTTMLPSNLRRKREKLKCAVKRL